RSAPAAGVSSPHGPAAGHSAENPVEPNRPPLACPGLCSTSTAPHRPMRRPPAAPQAKSRPAPPPFPPHLGDNPPPGARPPRPPEWGLGIDRTRFIVNERPTALSGVGNDGALGASAETGKALAGRGAEVKVALWASVSRGGTPSARRRCPSTSRGQR